MYSKHSLTIWMFLLNNVFRFWLFLYLNGFHMNIPTFIIHQRNPYNKIKWTQPTKMNSPVSVCQREPALFSFLSPPLPPLPTFCSFLKKKMHSQKLYDHAILREREREYSSVNKQQYKGTTTGQWPGGRYLFFIFFPPGRLLKCCFFLPLILRYKE